MDRKTANQLADELISGEKSATSEKRRNDSQRANGDVGLGHSTIS